jgi:DNA topoisomerase-3
MGKTICQRAIPPEQALKIFREGKSDLLPRFISKKGKPFAAYLKLEGGKVTFEFEPRTKKTPAKGSPSRQRSPGSGNGGGNIQFPVFSIWWSCPRLDTQY